ncbi:unnamed protein product, partial [Linum tenue]
SQLTAHNHFSLPFQSSRERSGSRRILTEEFFPAPNPKTLNPLRQIETPNSKTFEKLHSSSSTETSMASFGTKFVSRSSLSSIKSALRSAAAKSRSTSSTPSFASTSSSATPIRRFSISRIPSELGCAASLLPLHSAVATARMTSCLSTTSRSGRALSQGTLCCTYPGL